MDARKVTDAVAKPVRRHARVVGLATILGVAAILVLIAFLEGDLGEEVGDLGGIASRLVGRFGAPVSVALLYIEESGIPLPVPGDAYVAYLGNVGRGSWLELFVAWLAVVAAVTGGASNLYLLARRWGHRLVTSRYAEVLHLDSERLAVVEGWFARWGAIAIIFGRHIPGFRIPITVMAGTFEVPYRVFAPSVAVSSAVWAGIWLYLGARYGPSVGHFFGRNRWLYFILVAGVAIAAGWVLVRAWQLSRGGERSLDRVPDPESDDHDYEAREDRVAQGPRPQDVGGTENAPPDDDRDHPGDAPGG